MKYLCQDETRLGLKTIPGRLITAIGINPQGSHQWQRQSFYLYGVVEPLTRYSFFYKFSHLDNDFFQRFVELLSKDLGDAVAVLQLDQGRFHQANTLDWPKNIIPIFQTPHSPELNSIEQFWQFLKAQLQWQNCPALAQLCQRLTSLLSDTIIGTSVTGEAIREGIAIFQHSACIIPSKGKGTNYLQIGRGILLTPTVYTGRPQPSQNPLNSGIPGHL